MTREPVTSCMVGGSRSMQGIRNLIARIARSKEPVLIQGPTGSGKELVAQSIHQLSGRSGRMVAFNVCAIPESMFEDSLFGHVRGAFTGAANDSLGLLAESDGGTTFLDEIGGLSQQMQVKLLRAVETGVFRPVGGRSDRRTDLRVVAATNEPMRTLVESGRFRSDLAYRLGTFIVELPSLKERSEDIPQLTSHFAESFSVEKRSPPVFTACAVRALQSYDWPGNVRELRSIVLAAMTLAESCVVDGSTILDMLMSRGASLSAESRADHQKRELLSLLNELSWNTSAVARRLGVDRATVYRRMVSLGIPTVARANNGREKVHWAVEAESPNAVN